MVWQTLLILLVCLLCLVVSVYSLVSYFKDRRTKKAIFRDQRNGRKFK
ncbi:small membrane protein [Klebsiella variicola]|nr:small membrane protein [Klebsiella variicola]